MPLFCALLTALFTIHIYAQPAVPRPEFRNFQPINLPSSQTKQNSYNNYQQQNNPFQGNNLPMGATAADIIQQTNQNALRAMGVTIPGQPPNRQQQIDELHQLLNKEKKDEVIRRFQYYLNLFQQLNPDSFSMSKAVYLSEAVYYDKCPPYEQFEKAIKQKADIVKKIVKQEGLNIKNNTAVNYAIQKLFSQDNIIYDAKAGKDYLVRKISYDFDDFYGEKDWTKMFVSKILQTNSGQCHSLPLLYLCIAEQLHAKAYLSLAPNHSFIQYFDSKGMLRSFETTNGHLVSISWLMQSDAISSVAYKNKTYLDTLSQRKLFAECLADLQMAYIMKNGYDNFSQFLSQKILAIDSININALMCEANDAVYRFDDILTAIGNPPKEELNRYPQLLEAYNNMVAAQQKVNQTGYQDMPKEQYIRWLKSIDREKQKMKQSTNPKQ